MKNPIAMENVIDDVYKIMGVKSLVGRKKQITKGHELEGTTGISNKTEENIILEATKSNSIDQKFYIKELGGLEKI